MKTLIKSLISFAILLSSHGAWSADPAQSAPASGEATHHDWNRIYPQPEPNLAKSQPPAAAKLVSPGFMEKLSGPEVTLKWESAPSALSHLQVATDVNFKWLLVDQPLMSAHEYTVKQLTPNQRYFWRVYTQQPENHPSYTRGAPSVSNFEVVAQ